MNKPKQGEIILIDLDPAKGHEQKGYRPALVVSNKDFNNASNLVWICPITKTKREKPMDIPLNGTKTSGYVLCEQIRVMDLFNRKYKPTGDVVSDEILLQVIDIIQGAVDML